MSLQAGQQFDRYRIEALLGEGGMGQVYRAFDTRLHRRVALKVLHPARATQDTKRAEAMARMLREARAAAALSHPNVVAIHDIGETAGLTFLAMEFIEGRSLRYLIGDKNSTFQQKLYWMVDVAKALDAAHKAGLVHRDIKPENIMIRDDGVVKVLDFGIARRAHIANLDAHAQTVSVDHESSNNADDAPTSTSLPTLTGKGVMVGTPAYMSPEQIKALELDGRADEFSWGVVAYELFSGKMPWTTTHDTMATMAAVLTENPPLLSTKVADLPEGFSQIIAKTLEKDRDNRYQNMTELLLTMAHSLESISGINSVPAIPISHSSDSGISSKNRSEIESQATEAMVASDRPILASVPPVSSGRGADTEILPIQEPRKNNPINTVTTDPVSQDFPSSVLLTRGRAPLWGLLTALFLVVTVPLVIAKVYSQKENTNTPSSASAWGSGVPNVVAPVSSNTAPVVITDLPISSGCNEAAITEIRAGLGLLRNADWANAHVRFTKSVELDPGCATARLRLFQTGYYFVDPQERKDHLQQAIALRDRLPPRDKAFLKAIEPLVAYRDSNLFQKYADEAFQQFPNDAEIASLSALDNSLPPAELENVARRTLALDPDYVDALQIEYRASWKAGRHGLALKGVEKCLSLTPSSSDCFDDWVLLLQQTGECTQSAEAARLWISRQPSSYSAHLSHVLSLGSTNSDDGAFDEVLAQLGRRLPEGAKKYVPLFLAANRKASQGKFDEALALHKEIVKTLEGSESIEPHLMATAVGVEANIESGNPQSAARLAEEYFKKRQAWSPGARHLGVLVGDRYQEYRLLAVLKSESKVPANTLESWTTELDNRMAKRAFAPERRELLKLGFQPQSVLSSAQTDLRTWPFEKLHSLQSYAETGPPIDGLFLLGLGREKDAIESLRSYSQACHHVTSPYWHARSLMYYGLALEKVGDKENACKSYQKLIEQWGKAKPKSVTVDETKKRMQNLSCDKK